jgi:hypothetical protein
MVRTLCAARRLGLSTLIALLSTGCTYHNQESSYSDNEYYGGYAYRADYQAGYQPDEDGKAPPRIRPAERGKL